jgi:hypothetical protein
MKKSTLEKVLRRKIRIKITRRKRGRFRVTIPFGFSDKGGGTVSETFPRKKEALVWLYTMLRCLEPKIITIEEGQ